MVHRSRLRCVETRTKKERSGRKRDLGGWRGNVTVQYKERVPSTGRGFLAADARCQAPLGTKDSEQVPGTLTSLQHCLALAVSGRLNVGGHWSGVCSGLFVAVGLVQSTWQALNLIHLLILPVAMPWSGNGSAAPIIFSLAS